MSGRKKPLQRLLLNQNGLTLVEVLAAVTILSIIAIPFIMVTLNFARTGGDSQKLLDATYVAQTQIEEIYNLSTRYSRDDGLKQLENSGFSIDDHCERVTCYYKVERDYYIRVEIQIKDEPMTDVLVRVYSDPSMRKAMAQMERLVIWKG